jgi:ribose transport system permease protein
MSNDAAVRPPRKVNINFQALGIFIAAAVIFAIFGVLNSNFLTLDNLRDVAVSACVNALIGIGLTFVIITGGIDLSVGSVASFAGIVSANYMVNYGVSPVPALLLGLVLGFAAGAVNGLLITVLKLPAFIATLGTMSVYQGLAYVVTNGTPVYNVPQPFVLLLNSYISGVPIVVVAEFVKMDEANGS